MYHASGRNWKISVDTSEPMLIALYLRDLAGLEDAGVPAVSAATPAVKRSDQHQLLQHFGGPDSLRFEWEEWWSQLLGTFPGAAPEPVPPQFTEFTGTPALQNMLRAHFGLAEEWAKERRHAYQNLAHSRAERGDYAVLEDLVQEREAQLDRQLNGFELTLVELPLDSERAWLVESNMVLASDRLVEREEHFRSYFEPIIELVA